MRHCVLLLLVLHLTACADGPPTAPDAVRLPDEAAPPIAGGVQARFTRVRYNVTGAASLTITGDTARLVFSSDFTIEQTPGPVLYLNTTNNPNTGRPLRIGALRSRVGAQSYVFRVPAGVDYRWILIWCDPFNVPMAEAALPAMP
jgi:hypothetical protein